MNNPNRNRISKIATAAVLLTLAASEVAQVQGWETYPQGDFSPWTVAIRPDGTTAYAANDVLIRRGDAGGTLWSDATLPPVPSGYRWLPGSASLATSPAGIVYLAGGLLNQGDSSRTFDVFRSDDVAATWRSVFSVSYTSPRPPSEGAVGGLATDGSGNVYLANPYFPGTPGSWAGTLNYYRVRKGTVDPATGEVTWTVLDQYPGSGQLSHSPRSVTVRPRPLEVLPAEIWVAGSGSDAKTFKNPFPFVRRSLDGGATWATANAWPVPSGYTYAAGGIVAGADVNGVAYVAVSYQKKAGKTTRTDWLTYRTTTQGASWTLVDVFTWASGPASFAADGLGGVFIAGNGLIRASVDGGATWVSPDLPGANGVGADLAGGVFVGGTRAIYKLPAP